MSVELAIIDEKELRGRMSEILARVDVLLREIGPRLREVGTLRQEAALIYKELDRRGLLKAPEGNAEGPVLQR